MVIIGITILIGKLWFGKMELRETLQSKKGFKVPIVDNDTLEILSPHVVILGAGATIAALPKGDKNGKEQFPMKSLSRIKNIKNILNHYGIKANEIDDFEAFFSELYIEKPDSIIIKKIESAILEYYRDMILPDTPTIYDYLVLSLTEKDLIATFNWDPFIDQAIERNLAVGNIPKVVHLHGCVNSEKPKLLYPTSKKDYSSIPEIKKDWDIFDDYLQRAICLTIFGYSAPISDFSARSRIKQKIENNQSNELIDTQIIDIKSDEVLEQNWANVVKKRFFSTANSFENSTLFFFVRNTCQQYINATMQQNPQTPNPYPDKKFDTLMELQDFVKKVQVNKLQIR